MARFVNMLTSPSHIWPPAWSGTNDKAFVNFDSAAAKKTATGSTTNELTPSIASGVRQRNRRINIVRIDGERTRKKAARLRHVVWGQTLVEPSHALEIKLRGIRGRGPFRAARFSGDELRIQCARKARDDFVLHVEEVSQRLVKSLGPKMIARFRIDKLDIDAHAVCATLDATLEDVADVQFVPIAFTSIDLPL